MASLILLRTGTIADPIATWDNIEAAITAVEEKINSVDEAFVVTPFVPGVRTPTWVLTKSEIQGLEDRLHTIALYLEIPHILTTWTGLMPVNYNAVNHIIFALMPQKMIDEGQDLDGELEVIMPEGYDSDVYEIDYLDMFNGYFPWDSLDLLLGIPPEHWPIQTYDYAPLSFPVGEDRYHIYVAVVFPVEITLTALDPVNAFTLTFYDGDHIPYDANIVMAHVSLLSTDHTIVLVSAVIDPWPSWIRVDYFSSIGGLKETVSGATIPSFWIYSEEGVH